VEKLEHKVSSLDKKIETVIIDVQRIQYEMNHFKMKNERLEKILEAPGIRQMEQEAELLRLKQAR